MINDMASLKQAMEQMDADDAVVAEAAKDRAGQILSDAKLSFSKMADLIEQRRLLLRPKILSSIKRMDQPHGLGDAAFRDTSASLRREGQSFGQIAEALEASGGSPRPYETTLQQRDEPYRMEMEDEPDGRAWPGAPMLVMYILGYPFRHPVRSLVIALLVVLLFNGLRDLTGFGRRVAGYAGNVSAARESTDAAASSVSSFVEKWIMRPFRQAETPPAPPTPVPGASPVSPPPVAAPSTGPAVTAAPPATAPGLSTKAPASPSTAPSSPVERTLRKDARSAPSSNPAAKGDQQTAPPRALEQMVPQEFRRDSRLGGRCSGGVGGCYWGGGQY
jgi:hypothetical protein